MDDRSAALSAAVRASIGGWVERCVVEVAAAQGLEADDALRADARAAGRRAEAEVGDEMDALVDTDIDEQATTPLSLLRAAVRYPTEVLERRGVPPVSRDDFSLTRFPDDPYGLTPANFADVDPALAEAGLAWGAAKAWAHRRRHGGG